MKKFYSFLTLILLLSNSVLSQEDYTPQVDSLQKAAPTAQRDIDTRGNSKIKFFTKDEEIAFNNRVQDKSASSCATVVSSGAVVLQDCSTVGTPSFYTLGLDVNVAASSGTPATIPTQSETCTAATGYNNVGTWIRFNPAAGVTTLDILVKGGNLATGNYTGYIQFFQGTSCATLSSIGCHEFFTVIMGIRAPNPAHQEGIDPNKDVWAYVWNDGGKSFTLDLELIGSGNAPANAECTSPLANYDNHCNLGAGPEPSWTGPSNNGRTCTGGTWYSNENTMFYTIYTTGSTTGTIRATPMLCNDGSTGYIQMAVFNSCDCIGKYTSACYKACAVGESTLTLTNLIPGSTYILAVDGMAGDICTYDLILTNLYSDPLVCAGPPELYTQPTDNSICENSSTIFSAIAKTYVGTNNFQWQVDDGSGFANVTASSNYANETSARLNVNSAPMSMTGYKYRCIITNDCGTTISDTAMLSLNSIPPTPVITYIGNDTICAGQTVTLNSSVSSNIYWSNGSLLPSIDVNTSGNYFATSASGGCLKTSNRVFITVLPTLLSPTITASASIPFCEGSSVILSSSATKNIWSTGAATQSITVSSAGTYSVNESIAGCSSPSTSEVVTTITRPSINQGTMVSPSGCGAIDGTIEILGAGTGDLSWTGTTTGTLSAVNLPQTIPSLMAGSYNFTFNDGCPSVVLSTNLNDPIPLPPSISTSGPTLFCQGGSVTLTSSYPNGNLWSTGETSQSITVNASGDYSVTETALGCTSSPTTTSVTVGQIIVIAQGTKTNPSTCGGTGSVQITGSGIGTISWTGTSSGNLIGKTLPFTVTGLIAGSYDFTFNNGCISNTITVSLSDPAIPTAPTISLNKPSTFCQGGNVTLTSSATSGNIWSNGASTQSITVYTAGTYSVTRTVSGCTSAATSQIVIVNPIPIISLGTAINPSICSGTDGSIQILGTGIGNLSWAGTSAGSLTGISFPNTIPSLGAGTYNIAIFIDGCASNVITHSLSDPLIPATPTITASGPTSFCQGNSVTLSSSAPSANLWSTGETSQSITVSASGNYTVTSSNLGCTSLAATKLITVNPLPIIAEGTLVDPSECGILDGSIEILGSAGIGNLTWTGTTTGTLAAVSLPQTIPSLAAGSYNFTFDNGCTSTVNTTTLNNPPTPIAPIITVSGSSAICQGDNITLTSSASSGNLWSTGENSESIVVSSAGTYTLTTTVLGCVSPLASQSVIVLPVTTIAQGTIVNPTNCGANDGSIQIMGSGTGDLSWSGSNSGNLTGISLPYTTTSLGAGTYNFIYDDGCSSNIVTVNLSDPGAPTAPTNTPSGSTTFCQGGSVTLTSSYASGNLWSNGETTQSIVVTNSGIYSVSVTILGCTSASGIQNVVVKPTPTIAEGIVNNPSSCGSTNGSIQILGTGTGSLSWTGTSSGSLNAVNLPKTVSTLRAGTYQLTFNNGCASNIISSNLTDPLAPQTPTISANGPTEFCLGGNVILSSSASTGNLWSTGATTQSITVSTSGSYAVSASALGCTSSTSAQLVIVNDLPIVSISSIPAICLNASSYNLVEGSPSGGLYSGNGVSSGTFYPTTAGGGTHIITYQFTDGIGCSASTSALIVVYSLPDLSIASIPSQCLDNPIYTLIEATPNGGTYSGIGISNGDFNPSVAGIGDHNITYTYTDGNGCGNSITTNLTVNPLPAVTISPIPDVCLNEFSYPLTQGNPANGTYSGIGVTSDNFDATIAGLGTHIISYEFTDNNGCMSDATSEINVNPLTETLFSGANICSDSILTLIAEPSGGVYYGYGVVDGKFDANITGIGLFEIYYDYTDTNGCTTNNITQMSVNECPLVVDFEGFIQIYPNPANQEITIEFSELGLFNLIELVEITGRIVLTNTIQDQFITINISDLEAGYYTLKLSGNENLVKQIQIIH